MRYWIIIDHPHSLLTAISISKFLTSKKLSKPVLVIAKHDYWKIVNIKQYINNFSNIYWFRRIDIPPYSMPIWKQIIAAVLMFFKLIKLKSEVMNLGIKINDIIIGLSDKQILENIIISSYPRSFKIAIVPELASTSEKVAVELKKNGKLKYTIGGLIMRYIYCPIFNMYKNDYLVTKGYGSKSDGDRYWIFTDGLVKVFDKILLMVNITDRRSNKSSLHSNLKKMPFPYGLMYRENNYFKNKVVYFGMPYMYGWDISRSEHIEKINKYLDYIRKHYGKKYLLEYRPHPQEIKELKWLKLNSFKVAHDRTIAELYLLKSKNIKSVFSVCSTSSRSALNFGIESYVYPTLYPIKDLNIKSYRRVLGKVPKNFVLNNFEVKPKKIIFPNRVLIMRRIYKDLNWVLSPVP